MQHRLLYSHPAEQWLDALPIGNGRLGAMVYGRVQWEMIQLNEDSVWGRWVEERDNLDALKNRPIIIELLREGRLEEAEDLACMALIGAPKHQTMYQALGELKLRFCGQRDARAKQYQRILDMSTGIVTVQYDIDGVHFRREIFCSYPDQALVMRFSSCKKNALSIGMTIERLLDFEIQVIDEQHIEMFGKCGTKGTAYAAAVKVAANGGSQHVIGKSIYVKNADEITIYLTAMTDYYAADYRNKATEQLTHVSHKAYETVKRTHIADHQSYYDRVSFELTEADTNIKNQLSLIQRMDAVRAGEQDLDLIAKYFHYGRYLLIASSRKEYTPANLQGLWNNSILPVWDSKYTTNINIEMNYWPAELCDLSDIH